MKHNPIVKVMLLASLCLLASCSGGNSSSPNPTSESGGDSSMDDTGNHETVDPSIPVSENASKSYKEFASYMNEPETFPATFVYDDTAYQGFASKAFRLKKHTITKTKAKENHTYEYEFKGVLKVTLDYNYYEGYDAFDWTIYFSNISETENSKVLRLVKGSDYKLKGTNPVLKGILGDHENNYVPYEKELKKENVSFVNNLGRSCRRYFPYFNLETDEGGALLALGWGGTWTADFTYDEASNTTEYVGTSCLDFESYLKPGETVRTALNAVVRYYERDEDKAMNKWRRWAIDCNLPKDNASSDQVFQPKWTECFAGDTGKPNSDGSISEDYTTWKPSYEKLKKNGITMNVCWFDAGWYVAPNGTSPTSDWWGTVGTWVMDPEKWPDDTFRERVDTMHQDGIQTMVWFEPERVTQPTYLQSRYGYDMSWILSDYGNNNFYINNLGNPDCFDWTLSQIIACLDTNDIDIYREDFNVDPYIFFTIGDGYQDYHRTGITENLYYQGHYKLWDEIIKFTSSHGGASYVDSCASGGGRNDLETMRRSVPFLRSDSDRTTVSLKLAFSHSLNQWLPLSGAGCTGTDMYDLRANYLAVVGPGAPWRASTPNYANHRQAQKEWKEMNHFIYDDYYNLTPYHSVNDTSTFEAYEYFDEKTGTGLIQGFRQETCEQSTLMVKVKGVDPEKYYSLTDSEGLNSLERISGKALSEGYPITLPTKRSSCMIYINSVD